MFLVWTTGSTLLIKKDNATFHNNLGAALSSKGKLEEAVAEYREATRIQSDYAMFHENLAVVLEQQGQFAEALSHFRRCHELYANNPRRRDLIAPWVERCERLVELDGELPAILSGQKQPTGPLGCLNLAMMCHRYKQRYLDAVRFFRRAFAEKPQLVDDMERHHRYHAASSAALAGSGRGKVADKLDAKERARLRQQARDWLLADLKAYRQLLEKSADKAGPTIAQRMQHRLEDPDFAGVRDAESLAKLTEAECKDWHKLWEEVRTLRQRAGQQPKKASSARP